MYCRLAEISHGATIPSSAEIADFMSRWTWFTQIRAGQFLRSLRPCGTLKHDRSIGMSRPRCNWGFSNQNGAMTERNRKCVASGFVDNLSIICRTPSQIQKGCVALQFRFRFRLATHRSENLFQFRNPQIFFSRVDSSSEFQVGGIRTRDSSGTKGILFRYANWANIIFFLGKRENFIGLYLRKKNWLYFFLGHRNIWNALCGYCPL